MLLCHRTSHSEIRLKYKKNNMDQFWRKTMLSVALWRNGLRYCTEHGEIHKVLCSKIAIFYVHLLNCNFLFPSHRHQILRKKHYRTPYVFRNNRPHGTHETHHIIYYFLRSNSELDLACVESCAILDRDVWDRATEAIHHYTRTCMRIIQTSSSWPCQ